MGYAKSSVCCLLKLEGPPNLDKIFVNDYLKEVEIGAFQSEHGCTQRIKFNVCLEIEPISIQLDDNVDKVLSYEIITDAINLELSSQRFNLLETLAEKVANRCLKETRVTRVEVKIEKLDRVPGSLGVYISRNREPHQKTKFKQAECIDTSEIALISFPGEIANTREMRSWISALLESNKIITIVIEPPMESVENTLNSIAMSQVALLGMEAGAWRSSCIDDRLAVVSTKSELYCVSKSKKITLFCPSHLTRNSVSLVPDMPNNYDEFLIWLAEELGIKNLYLVGRDENKLKTNAEKINVRFFNRNDWNCF